MENRIFQIHPNDSVVVALSFIPKGDKIVFNNQKIIVLDDIDFGHKIAIKTIEENEQIIKYNATIGHATQKINLGSWVHVHNCTTNLEEQQEYTYNPEKYTLPQVDTKTFLGYRRSDGRVGIRNEIWIIPTVGCVNGIVKQIEQGCKGLKRDDIDAIVAYNHPFGCSQLGKDQEQTQKLIANLCIHPNTIGVVLVGLGCENSGIEQILQHIPEEKRHNILTLVCQDEDDEVQAGVLLTQKLLDRIQHQFREPLGLEHLCVGLKCGGSDGLSGITANPTVGKFSDYLIASGGTSVLTEVPEMFGAEQQLMNRCYNKEIFEKTKLLIEDFKQYFITNQCVVYENPSPGNKAGGITTLEDKSLGCTQKSGTATVMDVKRYGEIITSKGLNLYESPGNDLVAATALAASGCHIVLFTTGRGTPFASPVPTIKLSSNAALAKKKAAWIDYDCSKVLEHQDQDLEGVRLLEYVCQVASGKYVLAEQQGIRDLAIFKTGVML